MPRIIPDTLPLCADTCPNLNVWIEFELATTQTEIGRRTRLGQPRISAIVNGYTIPRAKAWEPLLSELRLDRNNFLRMVKAAKADHDARKQKGKSA